MHKLLVIGLILGTCGCATNPQAITPLPDQPAAPVATPATPTVPSLDLSSLPLSKFTHADIQNAAAIATANGYPARAAVWTAIDAQITACEGAIAALAPKLPTGTIGLATGFELAAEGIGQGIPASVKLNCSAVQLPSPGLLPLKLP